MQDLKSMIAAKYGSICRGQPEQSAFRSDQAQNNHGICWLGSAARKGRATPQLRTEDGLGRENNTQWAQLLIRVLKSGWGNWKREPWDALRLMLLALKTGRSHESKIVGGSEEPKKARTWIFWLTVKTLPTNVIHILLWATDTAPHNKHSPQFHFLSFSLFLSFSSKAVQMLVHAKPVFLGPKETQHTLGHVLHSKTLYFLSSSIPLTLKTLYHLKVLFHTIIYCTTIKF